jgi:hypothetical protein
MLLAAANVAGISALHTRGPVPDANAVPAARVVVPGPVVRDVRERRADAVAALGRRIVPTHEQQAPTTAPVVTEATPTVAAAIPPPPATPATPQATPPTNAAPVPETTAPPARSAPTPTPVSAPKPQSTPPTTFDERGTTPESDAPAVPFDDSGSGPTPPR